MSDHLGPARAGADARHEDRPKVSRSSDSAGRRVWTDGVGLIAAGEGEQIELLADVMSAIRVGVYVWEPADPAHGDPSDPGTMRLVCANPASVAATGCAIEAVLGKTMREAFPAFADTEEAKVYTEVALGGRMRVFEDVQFRRNPVPDRLFRVRVFALPRRRVATAFIDVTGERIAEAQVIETLESISEAFYTLDREGRFTYINADGERLVGLSRAQLLGRTVLEVYPQTAGQPLTVARERALREQVAMSMETYYEPWDKWLSARFYPNRGGLAVYFTDVTERKQLEAQLLQSQKLEAVGQLAAGVAHDFNNLLTVIEGYAALARARLDDDPHFVAEALSEIHNATGSAAALTAKLLSFSRTRPLSTTYADVNEVVASALDLVDPLIGEDITVHRQLSPEFLGARIDTAQIQQVIVNLAVNARDAMARGGNLWVTTATVELDGASSPALEPGSYASVTVRDDGSGMDADTLARIFEPFFTTKPAGHGTGLGLSTAFATLKQAAGHLHAVSTPGQGTAFIIHLPIAAAPAAPEPVLAPGPTRGERGERGDGRILLVEDDTQLRRLLAKTLIAAGYDVLQAGSHDEALRHCWARRFDLMITDGVRPGRDDVTLARAATAHQPHMAVLYISGHQPGDNSRVAVTPDATFLPKPFTADELTARVRRLLER
jgi:PAS domain S-box-containing protein